jgi:hypothetical protein
VVHTALLLSAGVTSRRRSRLWLAPRSTSLAGVGRSRFATS